VEKLKKTLEEKEANQKDAIESLENILVNLESDLDKFKDSSNVNKDIVVNIEGNLSVVKEQLQYAKDLDEKRYKMINDLKNKLAVVVGTLTEKESNIVDQNGVISELEKIIHAAQI
ncbi:13278_t:CDS:1, partial [Entrophospora sp. SA101]